MLDMFERFCPYAFTFVLGFSILGFCWACWREQLSLREVAGRLWFFGCCLIIALFFLAAAYPLAVFLLIAATLVTAVRLLGGAPGRGG